MIEPPVVLEPQHERLIQASGVTPQVAAARGYRTVLKRAELRALGFGESQARVPALLIPIHDVSGEVTLYQARPDVPRIKDGKALKYETPLKSRMVLDVPPGARQSLGNPAVPLFVTEGARKADAAVSRGLCCVALLGVWNWRGTNEEGGKVALPDWESVALNSRQIYIAFDSDVTLKPQVYCALSRLKAFLESRHARVAVVYLPAADGAKVGLDDYLAAGHGVEDLLGLATVAPLTAPNGEDAKAEKGGKPRGLEFEEVEPSREPVDGAAMLDEISSVLERFIVLPAGAARTIALWTAHTYLMDAFEVTPLLALSSPTKRCGKTTALRVLRGLVYRPLPASGISAAAIYRTVEKHQPTLLIDEMDAMKDNEDLRGVLNSGHTRDLAFVIRVTGDGANMEPRRFSTWCPKVLAHIGRLPGTLEDRAVRIPMRRKLPGESRERVRRRQLALTLLPLQRKLLRWSQDVLETVAGARPELPDSLDDRALDNWEPLLAIADAAGGDWPVEARKVALALSGERANDEADDNPGVLLLSDLKTLIEAGDVDVINGLAAEEVCNALRGLADRPWRSWGKGKDGLQPVHLARLLRPFGCVPKPIRSGSQSGIRRYAHASVQDAFGRYLPPIPIDPQHPQQVPMPQRANPLDPTPVAGVADVAGQESRCGSAPEREPVVASNSTGPTRLRPENPDVYYYAGGEYRVGDVLPDGRQVLDVDGPVLSKRRHPGAERL
jgi:hypothetical protein